jgi:hypothetical protein
MRAALPTFGNTWKLLQLCNAKFASSIDDATDRKHLLQTKVTYYVSNDPG